MKDHIWEHNNRYRITPVEGQKDQFDLIPVPGTVYQVGTPINKSTLLQDITYEKYKNAINTSMPVSDVATPNDVFNVLTNAFAESISIMVGESQIVGGGADELEGFAKWGSILHDATGKCTLDSDNYCTKLYIPKGIKKAQITGAFRYGRDNGYGSVEAKIYKNGASIQSIPLIPPGSDSKYHFSSYNIVIDTTGNGTEYVQLYLKGTKEGGVFASIAEIQCVWLIVRMLNF